MIPEKFEVRRPSAQNAVEIFAGRWASDLSKVCDVNGAGNADLFVSDPRPKMAADALGREAGTFNGMRVLELGPLEAGHSFQLERLGAASVLAVEANAEAFLKCLVVKELLNLNRCRFVLGDVLEFTAGTSEVFDMVFCSGILYHMRSSVSLIRSICRITDRCFVWTHYHNDGKGDGGMKHTRRRVEEHGFETDYYELGYSDRHEGTFWGGNSDARAWMTRDSILECFRHFGLGDIAVLQDLPLSQNGASMSFAASRG